MECLQNERRIIFSCVTQKLSQPTRTENTLAYHIPSSIRDYHLKSFFLWTARSWNILPEFIVQSPSVEAFGLSTTSFIRPKTKLAETVPIVAFGAETETETEFRSVSKP